MSGITPEAVERFIQTTMKEAVLSEGMPRNADDTKDAYATVSLLRALSARIAELEAQRSTLWQKSPRNHYGARASVVFAYRLTRQKPNMSNRAFHRLVKCGWSPPPGLVLIYLYALVITEGGRT